MPPKKNLGGKKGKGRAPQASKHHLPAPVSSSDEEENQGLAVVLRRLAALEKDNAMLKNQLKAAQPTAARVRSKSARVANKRCRSEAAQQCQAPSRPGGHTERSSHPAAQQVPEASTPTVSQEERLSTRAPAADTQSRNLPVVELSQATQGESSQNTPATLVWPAFGPWVPPPWNMGQMWPFSPPIKHEEQGQSEDTTQALNRASAMVWQPTVKSSVACQTIGTCETTVTQVSSPAAQGGVVTQTTQTNNTQQLGSPSQIRTLRRRVPGFHMARYPRQSGITCYRQQRKGFGRGSL